MKTWTEDPRAASPRELRFLALYGWVRATRSRALAELRRRAALGDAAAEGHLRRALRGGTPSRP